MTISEPRQILTGVFAHVTLPLAFSLEITQQGGFMTTQDVEAFVHTLQTFHDTLPTTQQGMLAMILDTATRTPTTTTTGTTTTGDVTGYTTTGTTWTTLTNWITTATTTTTTTTT
jgi:hypothetical protein